MKKQAITHQINRYGDFLTATEDLFLEFKIWKLETDLTHVELDGHRYSVRIFLYFDWLRWRLQDELQEQPEKITEDIQFITIC